MKISKQKKLDQMNTAELRQATRQYNYELPTASDGLPGRPLTPAERRQWSNVRKKMGRPKVGQGTKRVMISLESDLLHQSDAFAKKHHLNRSQMVSAGLRKLLAG